MKKNDIVTVTIEDFTDEGLGIGHCEGLALFVKDTVIGDVAEVKVMKMKKTYGYARLLQLINPSPDRVSAFCPVAKPCGGCQIQQMSYEAQLKFKEQKVRGNLQHIGGFPSPVLEQVIGMTDENIPIHFRNKEQVPVARGKDGSLVAGFYAGRTHRIVDCRDCLVGAGVNQQVLDIVLAHMERFDIDPYDERTGEGLIRHVMIRVNREELEHNRQGEKRKTPDPDEDGLSLQILVCLVINGTDIPEGEELAETLKNVPGMTSISLNINQENTNVILGGKTSLLWGKPYIEDTIKGLKFHIGPQTFYQVNPFQAEKLYEKVLDYAALTGGEIVWDLYCGIGTISLLLAKNAASVYGVEVVPEAVQDAKENARINGITNVRFYAGKAEEILPQNCRQKETLADVIVVDPPRKGCDERVLEAMLKIRPKRIVYVSCDSATLSRDLKILCRDGYELKNVTLVDMFCHTVHVETVAQLVRVNEREEKDLLFKE